MIEVESTVKIYEINGIGNKSHDTYLHVKNHGLFNDRIIVEFEGTNLTIIAADLKAAIENATNTSRF
jgi:hypothetical protein